MENLEKVMEFKNGLFPGLEKSLEKKEKAKSHGKLLDSYVHGVKLMFTVGHVGIMAALKTL